MTRRADEHHEDDATTQFAPVDANDAFLDAIARGEDPSGGVDPLAGLLLGLKREVDAPMPEAPSAPDVPVSLEARRSRLRNDGGTGRRPMNPWLSGLIGAAAATVVVAGSGAALYNATPGSALWGPASAVFGDRAAAVELASTLQELEVANQSGDTEHATELLEQAKVLVESMKPVAQPRGGSEAPTPHETPAKTLTVTVTMTETQGPAEPTQKQEPTAVSTQPAQSTQVQPVPSSQQAPSQQPSQPASPQPPQPSQATQPGSPSQPASPQQPSQPVPPQQPSQPADAVPPAAPRPAGPAPEVVSPAPVNPANNASSVPAPVVVPAPQEAAVRR